MEGDLAEPPSEVVASSESKNVTQILESSFCVTAHVCNRYSFPSSFGVPKLFLFMDGKQHKGTTPPRALTV